ncbi:pteridine transporter [Strigomonas culicis]|uniref:Pteridine transporter n=1 Tax=Strigomonas culicis TaxID=28005 RepID=S9TT02_9TRYP|nr:pteridine transporter [Strigomonas culicis]|eukprot:EPY19618.1 pteridine transporter [Strigomonas culicis]
MSDPGRDPRNTILDGQPLPNDQKGFGDDDGGREGGSNAHDDPNDYGIHDPKKGYTTHPSAGKLFKWVPILKRIPMFGKATDAYGPKLTISLGATNALVKGAAGYIIYNSMQALFSQRYSVDGMRFNRLSSMYTMGWSLQCLIAAISDLFPLFSYSKRWYCLMSTLFGGCFALGYGLMPAKSSSANAAGAFLFLTCLGKANLDILLQGLYSREIRKAPKAGPDLISWVWWTIFLGDFITLIQGPLNDAGKPQVGIIISAVFQIVPSIFSILNWYGERPNKVNRVEDAQRNYEEQFVREELVPAFEEAIYAIRNGHARPHHVAPVRYIGKNEPMVDGVYEADQAPAEGRALVYREPEIVTLLGGAAEFNVFVGRENWRILIFCGVVTAAVLTLAIVTLLGTTHQLLWTSIAVLGTIVIGAYMALPLAIANAAIMLYSVYAFYFNISGALDYFYVATPDCLPDGPHFSYTFYNTVGSLLSYCAGIVACMLFSPIFARRRYQVTFIVTTIMQVLASLFDLMVTERWNARIGIPDHATYLCGYSIIYQFVHVMAFMPAEVLNSRLVPRGCEAMVFSIISAFGSIGDTMSYTFGSVLMEFRFPVTTEVPCDYSNTRYLIIISHLCMPLMIIPLSFLLLPHCRICDKLDMYGKPVKHAKRAQAAPEPPAQYTGYNEEERGRGQYYDAGVPNNGGVGGYAAPNVRYGE